MIIILFTFLYVNISSKSITDINKNVVALSFDDGPSKYTKEIVEILDKYNYNATFFVLGNKINYYKDELLYAYEKGNEIGNHTFSHPWLTHLEDEKTQNEINSTNEMIINIIGVKPKLFRPSYGDINKNLKENINMKIVMWTNDSNDWKYKNAKKIAANVIRNIKDEDIILMHDTYKRTYEALKIILPKLKKMNYEVVTISELHEIKKIRKQYEY